ncbi:unnamed protein product [Clonostachys solani]|uniref:BTB domain-containing protein n=1 Tax=Clonostachys solani TaxID=160281 RepID=A0A9N9YZE8_9HYPO|nr:unnamed protein product [Clonostachys solani]
MSLPACLFAEVPRPAAEGLIIDEYVFDPDGDTQYILKNPSKPVTIDIGGRKRLNRSPGPESESKRARTLSGKAPQPNSDSFYREPPNEIHAKVSGAHLRLASPVFRTMITGSWSQTPLIPTNGGEEGNLRQLTSSEWDSEAILIMFHIMHGHHSHVPKTVSLKLLTSIATVVDYYQCHEIFEIFVQQWISALQRENSVPPRSVFGEDVVRWLSISWVFARVEIFNVMAETIVRFSTHPILANDLPVGPALGLLETRRQELVSKLFTYVGRIHKALCMGQTNCTVPDCASMLLGTLVRATQKIDHLKNEETRPADGYSLSSVMETLSGYRKPNWASIRHDPVGNPIPTVHRCSLEQFLVKPLKKIEAEIKLPAFDIVTKAVGTSARNATSKMRNPAISGEPVRRFEEHPKPKVA